MLTKHLLLKNIMILSQNFKNTLFPNTPNIIQDEWIYFKSYGSNWQITKTLMSTITSMSQTEKDSL
jgi:hypothetical protein